jgi:hypothetical protein
MSVSKAGPGGMKGGQPAESTDAKFTAKEKKVAVIDSRGRSSDAIEREVAGWRQKGITVRNRGNEKGKTVDLALPLVMKKKTTPSL